MICFSVLEYRRLAWENSYHNTKGQYRPPPTEVFWQTYHEAAVEEEHRELDGPEREPKQHAVCEEDLDDGQGIAKDLWIRLDEAL